MVREIRIFVEGGGDGAVTKTRLREGFDGFLRSLKAVAQKRHVHWRVIPCGGRQAAFDSFATAVRTFPHVYSLLLVDSEEAVSGQPHQHLQQREPAWDCDVAPSDRYHLMAQAMEAWFVADPDAVAGFYAQGFRPNSLPPTRNVEEVPKVALATSLKMATEKTQKGAYHKIRHASELLKRIDPAKVCDRAKHCQRLFDALGEALQPDD